MIAGGLGQGALRLGARPNFRKGEDDSKKALKTREPSTPRKIDREAIEPNTPRSRPLKSPWLRSWKEDPQGLDGCRGLVPASSRANRELGQQRITHDSSGRTS